MISTLATRASSLGIIDHHATLLLFCLLFLHALPRDQRESDASLGSLDRQ